MVYWDRSTLGWYIEMVHGMVHWDDTLGWYFGMVLWDGTLGWLTLSIFVNFTSLDSDAPTVTFSPKSTKKGTTRSPKFSWTSDEDATFRCKVEGVTQYQNCGDGTSGSWTSSNVPDGKHNFLVRARDKFGNEKQPFRFPFQIGKSEKKCIQ